MMIIIHIAWMDPDDWLNDSLSRMSLLCGAGFSNKLNALKMCDPISRKTTFLNKRITQGQFYPSKDEMNQNERSWIETEPAVCLAIDPLGVVLYFDPLPWFMHYNINEASICRLVQSYQCVREPEECFTQMALLIRSNYLRKHSHRITFTGLNLWSVSLFYVCDGLMSAGSQVLILSLSCLHWCQTHLITSIEYLMCVKTWLV